MFLFPLIAGVSILYKLDLNIRLYNVKKREFGSIRGLYFPGAESQFVFPPPTMTYHIHPSCCLRRRIWRTERRWRHVRAAPSLLKSSMTRSDSQTNVCLCWHAPINKVLFMWVNDSHEINPYSVLQMWAKCNHCLSPSDRFTIINHLGSGRFSVRMIHEHAAVSGVEVSHMTWPQLFCVSGGVHVRRNNQSSTLLFRKQSGAASVLKTKHCLFKFFFCGLWWIFHLLTFPLSGWTLISSSSVLLIRFEELLRSSAARKHQTHQWFCKYILY